MCLVRRWLMTRRLLANRKAGRAIVTVRQGYVCVYDVETVRLVVFCWRDDPLYLPAKESQEAWCLSANGMRTEFRVVYFG